MCRHLRCACVLLPHSAVLAGLAGCCAGCLGAFTYMLACCRMCCVMCCRHAAVFAGLAGCCAADVCGAVSTAWAVWRQQHCAGGAVFWRHCAVCWWVSLSEAHMIYFLPTGRHTLLISHSSCASTVPSEAAAAVPCSHARNSERRGQREVPPTHLEPSSSSACLRACCCLLRVCCSHDAHPS